MSSFFITGATGYIGSAISKKLISDGEAVTVIVRDSKRLEPEILSLLILLTKKRYSVLQKDMTTSFIVRHQRNHYI